MEENYLASLVGRSVQIYRGGPDSNNGRLLSFSGDHLALQKDDGEIIYYKTSHIKSIRENSMIKFNSLLNIEGSHALINASTFNELAANLKEQIVRVNGNGPESKVGKLIEVNEDFILLYTKEDGLIFFKEQHIKSISFPNVNKETAEEEEKVKVKSKEIKKEESSTEEIIPEEYDLMQTYGHIMAEKMNAVLTNLKYSWIKINRKGPESLEGLLVDSNDDHLVLAVDNDILRVSNYHVKNFSVNHKNTQDESDANNSNQKETKQKDQKETNQKDQKETKENNNGQSNENPVQDQRLEEQRINNIIRKRKRRMKNKNQNQNKKDK